MEAKTKKGVHRVLALALAFALCLSLLIGAAPARSGEGTWIKVTSADEITAGGSFAFVAQTSDGAKALGTSGSSNKLDAVDVNVSNGILSGDEIPVWQVAGVDGGISLYNGSKYLAYNSGTNFKQQDSSYTWNLESTSTSFKLHDSSSSNRSIAWNYNNGNDRFGPYADSNDGTDGYVFEFLVFKLDASTGGEDTVAAPQAEPQAGEVESGTEITLTCATDGANIYYTLDGSTPTSSSTLYSDDSKPTITRNCTLKAVAILDGKSSEVQTLAYTIKAETAAPIADGDRVVIYAPAYNKALSSEKVSTYYNAGTDVELVDGVMSGYDANDIWTVIDNEDGTFSFRQNDQNLGMEDEFASMNLGAEHDKWELIDLGGGLYNIKNTGRGNYMEWYAQFSNWSTYNSSGAATDLQFQLSFYKVTGDTPEPEPSEATLMNSAPEEGDIVLIYYPADSKVMSTTAYEYTSSSGSKKDELTALDATVSEGSMANVPSGTALFKVYEQDGHYVFKSEEGFLYLDGTNVRLVDSLGDYTYFDIESAENGWFIKSVNATYAGNPQYLEFYSGYFTCFGMNSGNEGYYTFQFFKTGTFDPADDPLPGGEEETEAPFQADDNVVIYAPSNNMALSATVKNSYYPIGVEVATNGDELTGYGAAEIWTVGGGEDGFTFANEGETLSMAGSYSSMYPGAGSNETWVLEPAGTEGQYYVKNVGRGTYMFWDDEHDDWTTRSDEKTAVAFYVTELPEEPEEVSGLEVIATPVSGTVLESGDTIELKTMDGATIYYTTDGEDPTTESNVYSAPLDVGSEQVPAPTSGSPLVVKAIAVLPANATEGSEEQTGEVCTFTYRAAMTLDGYQLYFGQLHSHTNISDGAGSVTEAFAHAAGVDNLDFLAVTDHSNSFDNESDSRVDLGADLSSVSSEWKQGHDAADAATESSNGTFVGIYGFEMTWSDGFGHINTFNTPGFESRSNDEFGNKSGSTEGYQNYYDKLVEVEDSLSQFNHPGTTFGDFQDFAFYDQQVDQRITLIEVGNGEGAIGSSGYFPSYEYYTRALDKGWHVAPTNNQDNHKGNWGDSNTARSVVLASSLTEDAIYDAIRNYRVYATEDNDLSILYSLNGSAMGSILGKQEDVSISAQIGDPTDSADMKVEVIVNGGLVIGTQTLSGGIGTVNFKFDSNDYSYYYLRITQADGNIAVTAPVWTGESVNAGISKTECDTVLVVKDEEVNISSELFNNSGEDMTVKSLVYSVDGTPIYTANASEIGENGVIASGSTATVTFPYTFTSAGKTTVNVEMVAAIDGTTYTFTGVLQLAITDESLVTRVLVDGTHYNDYVNGYYAGNMGNFTELAAGMNAQVKIEPYGDEITAGDLEDVALLVISAPLKYDRDGLDANEDNRFSDEFISTVADYVKNGGTVIVCGLADYQDGNDPGDEFEYTTYGQINKLLEGIGATIRVNDDELIDQNDNGGQAYRLYFDDFNFESTDPAVQAALAGLEGTDKVYSSYSGCSVSVGDGEAIVFGHDTTYSINSKNPAQGHNKPVQSADSEYDADKAVVTKGNVVSLATEAVGSGRVYVGGTVWMSDFEVTSDGSNGSDYGDASYANKNIITNILSGLLKEQEVSTIAEARANSTVGKVFTVEGTITAGNVEPNAFYDTIYIQDKTGGINIYPVATTDGTFRVGQKVRVTGSWDQYQGDTELRCISIELIDSNVNPIEPAELGISDAINYEENGGLLSKVSGTIKSVVKEGEAISSVILTDGTNDFRLLFNNYIGYSDESSADITAFVKEGAEISAVGVIYMDPEGVCLRIRDLSEVELVTVDKPEEPDEPDWPIQPGKPSKPSDEDKPEEPDEPFIDVDENDWFYDAVTYVYSEGMMDGVSDTQFAPNSNLTRGMVVTMLYRLEDEPRVTGSSGFDDVASGAWYADAVTWAAENGIVNGVSDTEFAPNVNITREQLAAILYRYAEYNDYDVSGRDDLSEFTDRSSISGYALDAMRWAVDEGLITGITDTTIEPQGTATRAQAATMFMRFMSTVR